MHAVKNALTVLIFPLAMNVQHHTHCLMDIVLVKSGLSITVPFVVHVGIIVHRVLTHHPAFALKDHTITALFASLVALTVLNVLVNLIAHNAIQPILLLMVIALALKDILIVALSASLAAINAFNVLMNHCALTVTQITYSLMVIAHVDNQHMITAPSVWLAVAIVQYARVIPRALNAICLICSQMVIVYVLQELMITVQGV